MNVTESIKSEYLNKLGLSVGQTMHYTPPSFTKCTVPLDLVVAAKIEDIDVKVDSDLEILCSVFVSIPDYGLQKLTIHSNPNVNAKDVKADFFVTFKSLADRFVKENMIRAEASSFFTENVID